VSVDYLGSGKSFQDIYEIKYVPGNPPSLIPLYFEVAIQMCPYVERSSGYVEYN
jgi:hypothetical protein